MGNSRGRTDCAVLAGHRLPRRWPHGRRSWRSPPSSQNLVDLLLVEARELRRLPARILAIDLYHARDEEFLLLVRLRLPEVRLPQRHQEARIARPFFMLRIHARTREGLDVGEVVEVPCLSNREGAVRVFLRLVHAHAARAPDGDDDDSRLLGVEGPGFGRRGRRGMAGVLGYTNVCDVGFLH
jgi:hypothetical protein